MTGPRNKFTASTHPTGDRGTDVGVLRAVTARIVGVVAVYSAMVLCVVVPAIGWLILGPVGLIVASHGPVYGLLLLRESDYTLYSLRLAIVDAVRTGEWRPR
jgi:hypothetical protein